MDFASRRGESAHSLEICLERNSRICEGALSLVTPRESQTGYETTGIYGIFTQRQRKFAEKFLQTLKITKLCVGIRVLTSDTIRWVIKPCCAERSRRFGRTYILHYQGRREGPARNQQLSLPPAPAGFLTSTILQTSFRNVGFSPNYLAI